MYKLGRCLWCWSQIWSSWALCECVSAFSHLVNPGAHTVTVTGSWSNPDHLLPILAVAFGDCSGEIANLPTNLPCVSATYVQASLCWWQSLCGNKAIFCVTCSVASLLNLYMYVYVYKVATECTCACWLCNFLFIHVLTVQHAMKC